MKTDNIFRFVSIRPPGDEETIERIPGDSDVIDEVSRKLTHNLGRRGATQSEAARKTGHEIVNSQDYVLAHQWGHELLAATRDVHRLLREASENADWKAFQAEARKLPFIEGDRVPEVERVLWRSYFAAVLNPSERPKDAESFTAWLVFLHLLKSDTAGEFSKRSKKVGRTRPAVPASFFFGGPAQPESEPAPQAPSAQPDSSADATEDIRGEITRLENARRELNDLFAERVRTMAYAVRSRPVMKADEGRGLDTEGRSPVAASQGNATYESSQVAAWNLMPDDFKDRAELIETVRAAGIIPELAAIPDVINHLDTRIAQLNADLGQLSAEHDIALAGKTFVRLRRPRAFAIREVPK